MVATMALVSCLYAGSSGLSDAQAAATCNGSPAMTGAILAERNSSIPQTCPTSAQYSWNGGLRQDFTEGYSIYWSQSTGARTTHGAIKEYIANRIGAIGFPTTSISAWAGGYAQHTSRGAVVWTESTGTHFIEGAIKEYILNKVSVSGFPNTDMYAWAGGYAQQTSRGYVVWTENTGAHFIEGGIKDYIVNNVSRTGFPTTDMYPSGSGYAQQTANGIVNWTASAGSQFTCTKPACVPISGGTAAQQNEVHSYLQKWAVNAYIGQVEITPNLSNLGLTDLACGSSGLASPMRLKSSMTGTQLQQVTAHEIGHAVINYVYRDTHCTYKDPGGVADRYFGGVEPMADCMAQAMTGSSSFLYNLPQTGWCTPERLAWAKRVLNGQKI